MNPHVKEDVGCPSDKTIEVDRLEGISHLLGVEPEEPMDPDDGFLESCLHRIDNQAQHSCVDSEDIEVAMPDPVNHGLAGQEGVQQFKIDKY